MPEADNFAELCDELKAKGEHFTTGSDTEAEELAVRLAQLDPEDRARLGHVATLLNKLAAQTSSER